MLVPLHRRKASNRFASKLSRTMATASLGVTASLYAGLLAPPAHAYQGMPVPKLHVSGRYLQDPNGKNVTLHGYMQPSASWFNGTGANFTDPSDFTSTSNVAPMNTYFNSVTDIMTNTGPEFGQSHGWDSTFVRFIGDDGGVSNFAPGWDVNGNLASSAQFNGWINNVLVPYINHCKADGLYVVICGNPSETFPGGDGTKNMTQQYQQNLITFWTTVASNPSIRSADNVMFEICNEPVAIETSFGANDWGQGSDAYNQAITNFMQPIANAIRAQNADNIIWIPGLVWQGQYQNFATYPITGGNIGYSGHLYPNQTLNDPTNFNNVWTTAFKPCADLYPMIFTELMWDPGNSYTLIDGTTAGFGTNVKNAFDAEGNISWDCGMVGDMLGNLSAGLANATYPTEAGPQSAFGWWPTYTGAAPTTPTGGPPEGVYEVSPSTNTNLAMGVQYAGTANGSLIDQFTWNAATAQDWYFHSLGNNLYWLEPQNSLGKCLDVININPNNGAGLQIWDYWAGLGQQWYAINLGNGYYRLSPDLNPTEGLDVPGGSTSLYQTLQTYFFWGAPGQQWRLSDPPVVTGQTLGTLRNNLTASVGFKFTTGSKPVNVAKLGRWVVSGNSHTHTVKIVRVSTGAAVATATVNTSGQTAGNFAYTSITPVTLAANTAYYILSSETSGGDQWYDQNTTLATTPAAAINSSVYYDTSYHLGTSGSHSYGPLSFYYY